MTFTDHSGVSGHLSDGQSMSIGFIRESTEELNAMSTQETTTQTVINQRTETSAQQTIQASVELEIGESTNHGQGLTDSSIERTEVGESSTQVTSETSAALEISESSATFIHAAGHSGSRSVEEVDDITMLPGGLNVHDSVTDEVVRETTQELSGSSTHSIARTSAQQIAEASTGQTIQVSSELKIGASTNYVQELTESSIEQTTQTSEQQTTQISTLTDNNVRESESGRKLGQSSIMLTTEARVLTNDAFVKLEDTTIEDSVRESDIRLSVGEEWNVVRESEGGKDLSTIDEQSVTKVIQGTTALSFESVQASTESAAYVQSVTHVQSSTQETSTSLETTTQVAVADSEQHTRERSSDIVSSSAQNISNIAIETVGDTAVETYDHEHNTVQTTSAATRVDVQAGECEMCDTAVENP